MKVRVAFQGEAGAYSELAAQRVGISKPCRSFTEVFEAVMNRTVEFGAIPLENSLGGTIHENYDLLLKYPVRIVAETYVRIEHCLLGLPGATLETAKQVLSHPQALAQCDLFLDSHPHLEALATYDTAGSAKMIREGGHLERLAIASEQAALKYGLEIVARGIASHTTNITRFAIIQLDEGKDEPEITPSDQEPRKTTIVFRVPHTTGSLYHALSPFAQQGINLTKIESRPYREQAFEYVFYVDFLEPESSTIHQETLVTLREMVPFLKVLGSYPCIPETRPDVDEPITVEPYNPQWAEQFHAEKRFLRIAFGDLIIDVQHIGSTAVPGLAAKPIVDILVGLQVLRVDQQHISALETMGYQYLGEAGIPGRVYFRKRSPQAFNVHVVQWTNDLWHNNLLLRDYLRSHPDEAHCYGKHKQELASQGVSTLLAYSEKKGPLISELLQRAQIWNLSGRKD